MKIHEFDPIIYPFKIWIVVSNKSNIIAEHFLEKDGKDIQFIEQDTSNLSAFVMPVMNKQNTKYGAVILFRAKKNINYELASHEASHAAKYLFEHIGADIKEHEPFEYVIGWIASCIEKVKLNKI